MRLIRSVLRPANIGLSLQFQQGQIIKTSSPRSVLIETSDLVQESNKQCHGRSYAASAPSDTLEVIKARRRVSKGERKSMVENYVNKYREMNAGKFPTVSDARKDVGGSYYVVRQILQELKYNSKIWSMDTKDSCSLFEKSTVKKDEISASFEKVSQTRKLGKLIIPISKVDIGDSSSKSFEPEERPRSSISVEASLNDETELFSAVSAKSKDVETQSHCPSHEPETSPHSDPENDIEQETIKEDKRKYDGLQPKAELYGRELHKVPTEDAEPPRKSSVWQNLKSFADGILGIWKRS